MMLVQMRDSLLVKMKMIIKKLIIPIIMIIIILSEIHEVEADNDHDQQVEVIIGS